MRPQIANRVTRGRGQSQERCIRGDGCGALVGVEKCHGRIAAGKRFDGTARIRCAGAASATSGSWSTLMTSALVNMARVASVMDRTSLPAMRGAPSIAHSEKWLCCSDSVKAG